MSSLVASRGFGPAAVDALRLLVRAVDGRASVERIAAGLIEAWFEETDGSTHRVAVEIAALSSAELGVLRAVLEDDEVALALDRGRVHAALRRAVPPAERAPWHGSPPLARCSCTGGARGSCAHASSVLEHLLAWLPARPLDELRWLGVRESDIREAAQRGARVRQAAASRLWSATGYFGDPARPPAAVGAEIALSSAPADPLPASGVLLGGRDLAGWVQSLIDAAMDPGAARRVAAQAAPATRENVWCRRLGIAPPSPEDLLDSGKRVQLVQLFLVAVLERGTPATIHEIAARLRLAGAEYLARRGDLEASLVKAWKGTLPLYRTLAGAVAVDIHCAELAHALRDLGLEPPPRGEPAPEPEREPSAGRDDVPGPDVPLSHDEVDAALRQVSLEGFSLKRAVAALLDGAGEPLAVGVVDRRLRELDVRGRHDPARLTALAGGLVRLGADGRLELVAGSSELETMRKAARRIGLPALRRMRRQRAEESAADAWRLAEAERARARCLETAPPRRAVVHYTGRPDAPHQLVVVDARDRSVTLLERPDARAARAALESFEELAGYRIHGPAEWTGLVDERRCIELMPPGRTERSLSGRRVVLSIAGICRAAVNYRPAPPDGAGPGEEPFQALRAVEPQRLTREALALAALLRYGLLHDGVRAARGDSGVMAWTWWAGERDARVGEFLELARADARWLELALVDRFDARDPFAHALRARVLGKEPTHVLVYIPDQVSPRAQEIRDIVDLRWAAVP